MNVTLNLFLKGVRMLKKSIALASFAIAACGITYAQTTISITSKIAVDNVEEELLNKVKECSKQFTQELAGIRSVTEVETTVDSDCGAGCKRELVYCNECGGDKSKAKEEITTTQAEIKCGCGSGKLVKACSSCNKPCNSCSSCCNK